MENKRKVLPINYTRHSVERMIALRLRREHIDGVVREGRVVRAGKSKVRMWMRKKAGVIVVTCALFPDEIRVVTVNIGGERER